MKGKKITALLLTAMCLVSTVPVVAYADSDSSRPGTNVYQGTINKEECENLVKDINALIDSGASTLTQINKKITEVSSTRDKIDRSTLTPEQKAELNKIVEPASIRLTKEKARLDSARILLDKFNSTGTYNDYADAYCAIVVCESSKTREDLLTEFFAKGSSVLTSYSNEDVKYLTKQFSAKIKIGEMSKEDAYKAIKDFKDASVVSDCKDLIYAIVTPAELNHLISDATILVNSALKSKTTEDIYLARIKVNSLPDCTEKDNLMEQLDGIIIDGLTKKTATAYLDVLLKAENTIQLDLSTSSLVIESYNGTEDVVRPKAVTATVSSSLPYDLGVTMEKPILGQETGIQIPDSNFQIRKSEGGSYVPLAQGTRFDIIKNSPRGKDMEYPIDLKVLADSSIKADHYKTVLKFQAEQI